MLVLVASVGEDPLTVAVAGCTKVSWLLTGLWQRTMQVKEMHEHAHADEDNNSHVMVSANPSFSWVCGIGVCKARQSGQPCAVCKVSIAGQPCRVAVRKTRLAGKPHGVAALRKTSRTAFTTGGERHMYLWAEPGSSSRHARPAAATTSS